MEIPKHIALIPDGNRRWAKAHKLRPWEGHIRGIEVFRDFVDWCFDLGAREVTAYALSAENLQKRSKLELKFLNTIYLDNLKRLLTDESIRKKQVRVKFLGDLSRFPKSFRQYVDKVERDTAERKKRRVNLCINYGGRQEIASAANRAIAAGKRRLTPRDIEKNLLLQSEPDLLIRTTEKRISNFLLWQLAYTELYFCPKLFPDFTRGDLMDAIRQYNKTQRRFGR